RAALSDGFLAPICPFLDLDVREAMETPRRRMLHPLWDFLGQVRNMGNSPNALDLPQLSDAERRPLAGRLDDRFDNPSAARIVSPPHHLHLHAATHPTEAGAEPSGTDVGRR